MLQAMLEGVTLGTLTQEVQKPAAGYLAFFTVALFLIGIGLLPHRHSAHVATHRHELTPYESPSLECVHVSPRSPLRHTAEPCHSLAAAA